MSQHLIKEIQELKRDVALLKEGYDANARIEGLWDQISDVDSRFKNLEETVTELTRRLSP
jgi:predicted  nucleic acid-binding Zn-ribbon protein